MIQRIRSARRNYLTDTQLRNIRKWISLYAPALYGILMAAIGVVDVFNLYAVDSAVFLFMTGIVLTVLALHRGHESKYGIEGGSTPFWPSVMYTLALGVLMVALYFSSPVIASAGVIFLFGTVYVTSR